ncbi:MAG: carboxypeptidase regulatory-like domain-containing protein [Planctomycetes bacterium]|nr:carboxypeptidase regulatory-like domain-containing protein [Planctomycetota bacterium]
MNRTSLLLLLVVLLLGVVAWVVVGEGVFATRGVEPVSDDLPLAAAPVTAPAASGQGNPTEASVRRQHPAAEVRALPELDPEFVANLPGIRGRLVDPHGKPLGGLAVSAEGEELVRQFQPTVEPLPWLRGSATSSADGTFEIPHLWSIDGLRVRAGEGSEWAFDTEMGDRVVHRTSEPGVVDLGDLKLHRAGGVRGRVLSPEGSPLGGVRVTLRHVRQFEKDVTEASRAQRENSLLSRHKDAVHSLPFQGSLDLTCEREAGEVRLTHSYGHDRARPPIVTDAEGKFAVTGLREGYWWVSAVRPGRMVHSSITSLAAGQTRDVELRLPAGRSVRGTVRGAAGQPIAGAKVQLLAVVDEDLKPCWPELPLTDAAGRFSIEGFVGEKLGVIVHHPRTGRRALFGPFSPDAEIAVALAEPCAVEVVVKTATGAPAEDCALQVITDEPWTQGFSDYSHMVLPVKPENGVFYLSPGRYWVVADGGALGMAWGEVQAAQPRQRLELTLGAQRPFSIEVVDRAGAPVFGARVSMCVFRDPSWYERRQVVFSDRQGRAAMPVLGSGSRSLYVQATGYANYSSSITNEATNARVVMHRESRLAVLLRDSVGAALESYCQLYFTGPEAKPFRLGANAGRAERSVPPGDYRLVRVLLRTSYGSIDVPFDATGTQVLVPEGGRAEVVVHFDSADVRSDNRLSGKVLVDGKPRKGVFVTLSGDGKSYNRRIEVGKDGGFALEKVAFRQAYLIVGLSWPGGQTRLESRKVRFEQPALQLSFDVATGSLKAEVQGASGAPLPRARCLVMVEGESEPLASVRAGTDGSVDVPHLPPGNYRLVGAHQRTDRSDVFTIRAGAATTGVVLRCLTTAVVAGRVTRGGAPPGADGFVLGFTDARGGGSCEMPVAADGRFSTTRLRPGTEYRAWLLPPNAMRRLDLDQALRIPEQGDRDLQLGFPR